MARLLLITMLLASALTQDPLVVKTKSGPVQGIEQEGTMAFLGIPYAKAERFMPPKPADKWKEIRVCDHFGPQAMQGNGSREVPETVMSEECLVLNVWTTDLDSKKPVMLWLHGGGFDSGSAAGNPGMGLAKNDVVVVSINHRLNILGFLDLSAVSKKYKDSANVGMMDVIVALRWIKANIKKFGGDPSNVTVFGESGGGGKVGTLLCMPAARKLFHKAIIMSGTILNVNTKEMSEDLGKAVLAELGIAPEEVEKINEVSYKSLVAAGQRAMAASVGTRTPGTPMMWGFGPSPDGKILKQQPFQPGFSKFSTNKPVMIGTTFNELQALTYNRDMTMDDAREQLKQVFGDRVEEYIEAFAKAYPDYIPQDLLSIDRLFRPKTLLTSDFIAGDMKAPTWVYMFNWRSPLNHGSAHGSELKFCFNTLNLSKRELPEPSAEDQKLADIMSACWAQFAHTGDPNLDGLPEWQPYSAENGELMVFDYDCYVRNNPDRELQGIQNDCCFKQLDAFNAAHPRK